MVALGQGPRRKRVQKFVLTFGRLAITLPPVPASYPHLLKLREHVRNLDDAAIAQPPRRALVLVLMCAEAALAANRHEVVGHAE